jgi:hypothetical protein
MKSYTRNTLLNPSNPEKRKICTELKIVYYNLLAEAITGTSGGFL